SALRQGVQRLARHTLLARAGIVEAGPGQEGAVLVLGGVHLDGVAEAFDRLRVVTLPQADLALLEALFGVDDRDRRRGLALAGARGHVVGAPFRIAQHRRRLAHA